MKQSEETLYRLAVTPAEYEACHEVIKRVGLPERQLKFPTVYAKRGDEVVGVAARGETPDMIVLFTLAASCKPPHIVLMRLVGAFEEVLRSIEGITEYRIAVAKDRDPLNSYVQRILGYPPYAETPTDFWYRRELYAGWSA